ncbi:MAG TPA: hypothetical protein VJR92_14755 [Gemmatimonadaceae bacterium]|nr:hypothetical protein [Gemmatimonadaceae bacterium]
MSVRRAAFVAVLWAFALTPVDASARQNTRISLSGFPLQVLTTTGADFEAGFVSLGTTSFSVNATTLSLLFVNRTATVAVLCDAGSCPNAGALPVSGLQWRRADLATWNTLTTSPVDVETRSMTYGGTNDPWGNSLVWRYLLNWTSNPPAAMTRWRIRFQLTVTAP